MLVEWNNHSWAAGYTGQEGFILLYVMGSQ